MALLLGALAIKRNTLSSIAARCVPPHILILLSQQIWYDKGNHTYTFFAEGLYGCHANQGKSAADY